MFRRLLTSTQSQVPSGQAVEKLDHSNGYMAVWLMLWWCVGVVCVWFSERLQLMRRMCYQDLQTPTALRHNNCPAVNDDVTQPSNHFSFSDASRSHLVWLSRVTLQWPWPWPWPCRRLR